MSSKSVNKIAKDLFIYVFLLFILLIVSINISNYLKPKEVKVLGSKTENIEEGFWQNFLTKNPDYIPGWIEIGRTDKASEIDPNYIKP
jgi:hypothetical protein